MKTFKRIFYPLYIVTIILVAIVSFDIMESLTVLQSWGFWKYFNDLPFIGRNLILFLSLLMVVELVIENIVIRQLKRTVRS
jgi:hypothetical protein